MSGSGEDSVVLDLRCLQDPDYVRRGIGRHALAILRTAPRGRRIVGLTDPSLPTLLPEARQAVDEVRINAYAASRSGMPRCPPVCFIMMSPMTHDPIFAARLLSDPTLLRAAVVYDFIPHRLPSRYLPTQVERLAYALALRWLARCDLFLPISRSSADDLTALSRVAEHTIAVTGCSLEPAFEERTPVKRDLPPRHLLVVGGGDPRKNPEVVIRAHARSKVMQDAGTPLVIAGNYGETQAQIFRATAAAAGGREALVEVPGHLPDERLLDLYREAFAVVSSSYDEGFSIPLIEGMAVDVPCLASDIPAHAELVTDPHCRFPADDDMRLCSILERIASDAAWRTAVLERQAKVWPRFRAQAVGARFWNAVTLRLDNRPATILRHYRPRVALLSPVPPDRSGVADYSAATCAELGKLVDLHVFTETAEPAPQRNVATVRPLSALPSLMTGFDRVINVVGNSHFHVRIFELLHRYGGACIAHDARMLAFYRALLGRERALAVAGKELGRSVKESDLTGWLGDEGKLEALFLGEIAESATPTIVHSPVTAQLFEERYGVIPCYLPFSIYRPWTADELTPARRSAARARLGLEAGEVAIATFGFVHSSKAPEECIWALEVLRGWGIPASLHFVGGIDTVAARTALRVLVDDLGLTKRVHFAQGYVSEQDYRDYLVGADLGVQLRTYSLGALSGGLLDCAAAGLPTVTNESLGAAVGVPRYIHCIPDALSPLLLAEALATLLDSGLAANRPEAARRAYSEQRSFTAYSRGLCRALELDVRSRPIPNQNWAAD
jgi:glycosyltransferase involved in cell wall biosynthesis